MDLRTYDFRTIEKDAQAYWKAHRVFQPDETQGKPKRYILDMFPYPSASGLHVGHLFGYFASDVLAVYARMQGHAVLHPMGYDAFGLPAEQHAIDTGQHPATIVAKNIKAYKRLLEATGITFDWEREIKTTDPAYYRWTQWIFLQLFGSWYNPTSQRAEPLDTLKAHFAASGRQAVVDAVEAPFTPQAWAAMTPQAQEQILNSYRLAYLSTTWVNWCPELGTVLANDEVRGGYSERGGHPVIRRKMRQWRLRIHPYLERLLAGLDVLDWPDDVKAIQRHWIGKSTGSEVTFHCASLGEAIQIFTTRLDTLLGTTYIALSPEHPLVQTIIAAHAKKQPALSKRLEAYIAQSHLGSRTRTASQEISGLFTGCYAQHPITGHHLPIWVASYVLPHYGAGAIMGVPAHDQRDYRFAQHFGLPMIAVLPGGDLSKAAHEATDGVLSEGIAKGLTVSAAQKALMAHLAADRKGRHKVCYRMRDPVFSRQRYWGEPFPICYQNGRPQALPLEQLPLELPQITNYKPKEGAPPLSRANWTTRAGAPLEQSTMPAWAGSNWYFLRYMDPHNEHSLVSPAKAAYWGAVDCYFGGKEHATGHLLYARFLTKFLYDRGYIDFDEPFTRLVNQGMVQHTSYFVYRIQGSNQFVSHGLKTGYETTPLRVATTLVHQGQLNLAAFKQWRPDLATATFILENGIYRCGQAVEKMSKSKHNTVDPSPIIAQYGVDVLRLHLLFLGPLRQDKPWGIKGIEGLARWVKKVWLAFPTHEAWQAPPIQPPHTLLVLLHRTTQEVQERLKRLAFHTAISSLMVFVNQLTAWPHPLSKTLWEHIVLLIAPFTPHLAEHLWHKLGHTSSVMQARFPTYQAAHLQREQLRYPVAVNGKCRSELSCPIDTSREALVARALELPRIQRWIDGRPVKKVIVVLQHMINIII